MEQPPNFEKLITHLDEIELTTVHGRITEVVGMEQDIITLQDIFLFEKTGIAESGKVLGRFRATGAVPTFLEELKARGLELDPTIFQPDRERAATGDRK